MSRRAALAGVPLALGLLAAPAAAHDWYTGLASPSGERCCTENECEPVDHRYDPESHRLEVGINGVWVPVDPAKVVAVPSPDGAAHACFERHWMVRKMTPLIRCIILPVDV